MYQVSESERQNVLKLFGRAGRSANRDVEAVKAWLESQGFPEVLGHTEILNFLQLNKFNVGKTKSRIEAYYTIRRKHDLFSNCHPKLPQMQQVFDISYCFNHSQALDPASRLWFLKMRKPNSFPPVAMLKMFFNFYEVRLHEDCMVTDTLVIDMDNFTFRDVLKVYPTLAYQAISIYKNVFALRVKAIHLLNSPLYVSIWLRIFKLLLKQKIFERIHVHRDSEILNELLAAEALPEDYGGQGSSLAELTEMARRKFEEYEGRFDELELFARGEK